MTVRDHDRMRVLHLTAPAVVGGLERVVTALSVGHLEMGHEVHVAAVLAPDERDHPFIRTLNEQNVTTHSLVQPVRAYWKEWRRVAKLCKEIRPHVVHSHSVRTDVVSAGAARRQGIPVVTTVHGASLMGGRSTLYEWLQRKSYRSFDAIVAVSLALREQLTQDGLPPDRVHLIPNAWAGSEPMPREQAREELGLPRDGAVIGWAARMIPVKAGDLFVQALALLPDLGGWVVVIGDGPERAAMERAAAALPGGDRIRFVGTKLDAGRLFSAFDVFVLSSRSEGVPIVLFEAMAAGAPIVATQVGGVPDVLSDDNAVLVDPEDPVALAEGISRVFADPEAARLRARRAAERLAEQFALSPWLDRYEAVYRQARHQHD